MQTAFRHFIGPSMPRLTPRSSERGSGQSYVRLFTRVRGETVWKLLRTGQPPHHESRHRHVDKGLLG
jgi:hypothetical protein